MSTEDPKEIAKFEQMAHEWWEPEGKFKPLHQINPVRMRYIRTHLGGSPDADLSGLKILDVGCGGGILSEALYEQGAKVTAIDRSDTIIAVARAHQRETGSDVDYRMQSTSQLLQEHQGAFDAVMVMEVLEHVPDVTDFLAECAALTRPNGWIFFSTLNRTFKSWLFAIVGAEYVLRWLPRGTHQYDKFIRPSDLEREMRTVGFKMQDLVGVTFHPLTREWGLSTDPSVNFLGFGVRQP